MNSEVWKITGGQILLIICCIFYLIWWSISYRPGVEVNRLSGLRGILLFITALSGLAGVAFSVYGVNEVTAVRPAKMNGGLIVLFGIAAYIILLFITRLVFKRPVTTELLLISGWVVLELTVINSLNSAGILSDAKFRILLFVIAAAFLISMILYVLYYRMEPMRAFYAAMVPLITEGVSMLVLVLMSLL